jgi:hypothetical protein
MPAEVKEGKVLLTQPNVCWKHNPPVIIIISCKIIGCKRRDPALWRDSIIVEVSLKECFRITAI